MTTFILHRTPDGTTVTPWDDATPSARKAHRRTGNGFTITAPTEQTLRRTLGHYFQETP